MELPTSVFTNALSEPLNSADLVMMTAVSMFPNCPSTVCLFHLHEENQAKGQFKPDHLPGTTVLIGLFVPDVDQVMARAIEAGAEVLSPAQSYDYGYRQGEIKDPFGHVWMIEMKI